MSKDTNFDVMVKMLADPDTPPDLQVNIMSGILEAREDNSFFTAMFRDLVSFGACPHCGHENHWLIPERDLNQTGYVSAERDQRVKRSTTGADCPEFGEACVKKKILV